MFHTPHLLNINWLCPAALTGVVSPSRKPLTLHCCFDSHDQSAICPFACQLGRPDRGERQARIILVQSSLLTIVEEQSASRKTATIEIYTKKHTATPRWRFAKLSYDKTTESNLISPKLVTEVLGRAITPSDMEYGKFVGRFNGQDMETQGYVDLVWCFQNQRNIYEHTRFVVTSTYDPPFDAVLGRRDSIKYGIVRDCG